MRGNDLNPARGRKEGLDRNDARGFPPAPDSGSAPSLYSLRELGFSYGRSGEPALRVPGLDLEAGECVAFTGPNGSGKTTMLKILNDLLPEDGERFRYEGELRYKGEIVRKGDAALKPGRLRAETVYLHQHPYILAGSVWGNMLFACTSRGMSPAMARLASRRALRIVGLDGYGPRGGRALSGGETQRLALARIIAVDAPVLLLDEPTSSADSLSCEMIAAALLKMAAEGKTIVLSTHDPRLMDGLKARRLEFRHGKIIRDSRRNNAL